MSDKPTCKRCGSEADPVDFCERCGKEFGDLCQQDGNGYNCTCQHCKNNTYTPECPSCGFPAWEHDEEAAEAGAAP